MFNLLPIPPLDGSKIVGAFLPDRLYYRYLFYERYGMIILIILLYTGILTPLLRNGVNNLIGLIIKALALLGL
jgi:Zn-dependent protease